MNRIGPHRLIGGEVLGGDDTAVILDETGNRVGDCAVVEIRRGIVSEALHQRGEIAIVNRRAGGLRLAVNGEVDRVEVRVRRKQGRRHRDFFRLVPNRLSAASSPAISPGTAIASAPVRARSSSGVPLRMYIAAVAAFGATSR